MGYYKHIKPLTIHNKLNNNLLRLSRYRVLTLILSALKNINLNEHICWIIVLETFMQWNVLWLLQIKRYICLFIKLCQRTLKRKKYYAPNSKLLMNIFSHALQNRIINTIASFCAKIYSYICPWTLSVSGSSQFSLSFALGILFASWNR